MTGSSHAETGGNPQGTQSPVALLVYRRPDTTARVFRQIARARPTTLLVIADGPREGEEESCRAARAVTEQVDWPCNVARNYADENMGCGQRVASGLTWVFNQVEEAVVLEDDTVPDLSFFAYCDELLDRYRHDERVMAISGDNFQIGPPRTEWSYYFSLFNHVWGWATWSRAWRHFDLDMRLWPEFRAGGWLKDILGDDAATSHWTAIFEQAHRRQIDTWDFAWTFACWAQSGLTALPRVNLVTNIGFDARATHTKAPMPEAEIAAGELAFPLRHPPLVVRDARADACTLRSQFQVQPATSIGQRLRRRALNLARRATGPRGAV